MCNSVSGSESSTAALSIIEKVLWLFGIQIDTHENQRKEKRKENPCVRESDIDDTLNSSGPLVDVEVDVEVEIKGDVQIRRMDIEKQKPDRTSTDERKKQKELL